MFKKMGPGVLVAAAFIGPGTVTACTLAGVGFGFSLLWALLLSIIATIVLQEMSARLGIITQNGLANAIRNELSTPWIRMLLLGIILAAIVVGNAAYEAGNIGGATLGLNALFGEENAVYYPYLIGMIAFMLLYLGNYKTLEKVFVSLVIIMSLSFLLTAMITKPNLLDILKGLFVPKIPEDGLLTIIALVGTTVVP
ncbi:MAG: Nramp family divalent metal transporter, partial [Maribacter sp.]|uniref:Nramp family divalent metal transporter n=1 Tax=Maribacter sp. TaxID=1897614 RepID=UPI003C710DA4